MAEKHKGTCFCGAVEITVTGEPEAMGFCHCESCRHWSASPVNAFTLWRPDAVTVTKGEHSLSRFNKTANSSRMWCKLCGGHLMTDHPRLGVVDVYAATLADLPFRPEVHVNYAQAVHHIADGLPKLRDFPKEMGGSGIVMQEAGQVT